MHFVENHFLKYDYIRSCKEKVTKEVIEYCNSGNVRTENSDRNAESFLSFIQLFQTKRRRR